MKFKKVLAICLSMSLSILGLSACASDTPEQETPEVQEESSTKETSVFTGKYIVDAEYVKNNIDSDNVILIDARGADEAKKGTISGATAVSWQELSNVEVEKGSYDWGLILEPELLSAKLGELGLSKDKEIILFSKGPDGWGEDGRILWTLRAAGYENLKMVDGGIDSLLANGLEQTKTIEKLEPVKVVVDELDYSHVINTKELEEVQGESIIVDVREDKEWEGQALYGEVKGGRLPNAIQIKFKDLFGSNGYLKSNEELTALFKDAGVNTEDQIVLYCTSGIRSAYSQLVMEMLGYNLSKNYDGSYNTWCANNEVETGTK